VSAARTELDNPPQQRELIYVAICRVVAVPLYLGLLAIEQHAFTPAVWAVVAGATIYSAATVWLAASRHWPELDARWLIPLDLALVGVALVVAGGPEAAVRVVYFVWLVAMALLYAPRMVMVCALCVTFAFAAFALPKALESDAALRALGVSELSLAWIGLVTYFVADAFWRREQRIERLSLARRQLLAETLSAEERARRRLSQSLHDDALQVLLAAGQDLDAGLRGDRGMLERAREDVRLAVSKLRDTVRGLHPAALEHGGLAGAIDSVVERNASRADFIPDVRVDSRAAGVNDALLISVASELATNAAKHADADNLLVRLSRRKHDIVLEVADDGRGMTADLRDSALAAGHIGLASCGERVEAAGGALEIVSAPAAGAMVRVVLPAGPAAQ
jgi:two-component system NarL family sensor kinase